MEDQVEFVAYNFKGRSAAWWNQFQNIRISQGKSPINTRRRMKRLLQDRCFTLEEEEIENRPQPLMRSYGSNEIAELQPEPPIEE